MNVGSGRSRDSAAPSYRQASVTKDQRVDREGSATPSLTQSHANDKKKGFSAFAGLLKRKAHGQGKGEGEWRSRSSCCRSFYLLKRCA
jgi:hypothetical protein